MVAQATDQSLIVEQRARLTPFQALAGVLIRPRRTFQRMREAERGHWWVVFALALVALVLVTVATVPVQSAASQAAFEAQQEQFGELSPEQQAQIEQTQQMFSSTAVLSALGTVTGIIGLLIGYAVRAGVLFLLGMALGGQAQFKQIWRMAVWTTLPLVLGEFITGIAVIVSGQMPAAGLTYIFTDAELSAVSPVVTAILGRIDLYVIWSLALVVVGMVATARLSRVKGAVIAAVYWLLGTAGAAAMAGIGQAVARSFGGG